MNSTDTIYLILLYIAIVVVIFLILREAVCWYSKINKRVSLQKETNQLLKQLIDNKSKEVKTQEVTSVEDKPTNSLFCTNCGHENELGVVVCSNCSQKIE